jgi:hypothetical protein
LEYEAGKENENDMKAKRIKINLNGAEIMKWFLAFFITLSIKIWRYLNEPTWT